jgi:hypothetical protein
MSDPLFGTRSAAHLNLEVRGSFCPHSVPLEKFIGTGVRTDYSALRRNFSWDFGGAAPPENNDWAKGD